MKRFAACVFLVGVLLFASGTSYADSSNDTFFDQAGDWFATVGKPQQEKDRILFERHTDRAAKKLQESFDRGAKKAGKDLDRIGKDIEKAFK